MQNQNNFVVADPHMTDCPVIFASRGFCNLSGSSTPLLFRLLQFSWHACVRFRARRNAGQELPNASRKGYKHGHGQFRPSFLFMADSIFSQVNQISQAVANKKEIHVILLNYCKNGTPFWNLLHLSPVLDVDKRLVSFVGSQVNVSAAVSLLLITLAAKVLTNVSCTGRGPATTDSFASRGSNCFY